MFVLDRDSKIFIHQIKLGRYLTIRKSALNLKKLPHAFKQICRFAQTPADHPVFVIKVKRKGLNA